MTPQLLDEVGTADHAAGLRTAEELVTREADEVGTGAQALRGRRLVSHATERARAEVVHYGEVVLACELGKLGKPWSLREADDPEVGLVHPKEHSGLGPDRLLVVGHARSVRRSHLDQTSTRARENVRYPEPVADLDQLAPRDDDLPPFRQGGERQQDRGGVVVDDECGLGAGEAPEQRAEMILSRSARTLLEVVLEVRVRAPRLDDTRDRGIGERRTPEIRVHEHPGGVQQASERRPPRTGELIDRGIDDPP